ncbi:MAG: helix-hairpin-helix domain-containing protein [Polyangia bacterium]
MTRFVRLSLFVLCGAIPVAASAQSQTGAGGERTADRPGMPDDRKAGANSVGKVDPSSAPQHSGDADPTSKADPATEIREDEAVANIDINRATGEELKKLPGINDEYAGKIIAGRPYKNKRQLKKILPKDVYKKMQSRVVTPKAK